MYFIIKTLPKKKKKIINNIKKYNIKKNYINIKVHSVIYSF